MHNKLHKKMLEFFNKHVLRNFFELPIKFQEFSPHDKSHMTQFFKSQKINPLMEIIITLIN